MVQDLASTTLSICLFPLFLLFPGYVLGWLADVLSFRRRRPITQVLLSVVLSVALSPILTYLAARVGSFRLVGALYAAIGLAAVIIFSVQLRGALTRGALRRPREAGWLLLPLLVLGAWAVVAMLSLADLQIGDRLYYSMVSYDYTKRIAATAAIARSGIPLVDYNLYPGHPLPMFYYYFWFMLCGLIDRLGGTLVDPRGALFGGTVWVGVALMALVALCLRFLRPEGAQNIRTRAMVGIGLLFVGGADFLIVFVRAFVTWLSGEIGLYPSVDWWNEAVNTWPHALFWVPHHVAALIAGVTGFLLVRAAQQATDRRHRLGAAVLAGLAFASTPGLSIWVALPLALFMLAWAMRHLFRREFRQFGLLCLTGAVVALAALPLGLDLIRSYSPGQVPVVALTVRLFYPAEGFLATLGVSSPWIHHLVNLLLLPLNYGLEFGFFGLAALVYWKHRKRSGAPVGEEDQAAILMLAASLLVSTFLKSQIILNDLGWQAPSPAVLVLLLWAVEPTIALFKGRDLLPESQSRRPDRALRTRRLLFLLFVCGVLGIAYEIAILKSYTVLVDAGTLSSLESMGGDRQVGRRTMAVRQAYQWINTHVPAEAIVQHNPDVWLDLYSGLYGQHQSIVLDTCYGTTCMFPADFFDSVEKEVAQPFAGGDDLDAVDRICDHLGISVLLVKDKDPVWSTADSWMTKRTPLFANDYARVFACGTTTR